jgi:uncharacterized protein (DUF1778 family)
MSITVQEHRDPDTDLVDLEVELDEETHDLLTKAAAEEGLSLEHYMQRVIETHLANAVRDAQARLEARIGQALPSMHE